MIHKLPHADWHIALGDSIKSAQNGDTIIVHNQAQKRLGELAVKDMRPNTEIYFEIEEEEEWLL